jgi:hypothetical protein
MRNLFRRERAAQERNRTRAERRIYGVKEMHEKAEPRGTRLRWWENGDAMRYGRGGKTPCNAMHMFRVRYGIMLLCGNELPVTERDWKAMFTFCWFTTV